MELRLATPPLNPSLAAAAFQPSEVERQLALLRQQPEADASRNLLDLITAMNRARLPSEARAASLEKIVPVLRQHCARLRNSWRQAAEGDETAGQSLRLALDLAHEAGYGYKHLLLDSAPRRFGLWAGKPDAALVRATLHTLSEILMLAYESYQPVPAGLWQEIHQLYRYAREHHLLQTTGDDGHTVEWEYKRCLLQAIADPYHLERGDLVWLIPYLLRHADRVELGQQDGEADRPSLFRIRLDSDKPPLHRVEASAGDGRGLELVLDVQALPATIRRDLTRLKMGEAPTRLGLPPDASSGRHYRVLGRIYTTWEGRRQRKFARRESPNVEFEVLTGVATVHDGMSSSAGDEKISICTPIDDSPLGISMQTKSGRTPASVGELVATRERGHADWTVGVVRWVKGEDPGRAQFGVQLMAPGALPVSLNLASDRGGRRTHPALLLQSGDPQQPALLVAQPGLYREERRYEITNLDQVQLVRAGRAREQTGHFDLFEIAPVDRPDDAREAEG
jgi:hypothetical protein